MIDLEVPFENIGYEVRESSTLSRSGIKPDVIRWLEERDEGHNRLGWRLAYYPKRARLQFKSKQVATLFKLTWG